MKFVRLYLKAFGPFRDRVIELPGDGGKDLHVIFGPNEAGKSTLLRAVRDFLFGVPERTGDAFLHDYNALRIGATLLLPDGSRLSAMRRKARKATLFAIDERTGTETTDRPLPEDTLTDLLGGLDQALYQNLFGLDLNGLVAGSDELLRGEGEVGRSLFQAAAGLANLRSLITGLEEEATAAFKPRGSTSRLNRTLNEFDDQRRILKDSTVRSYAWETAEREHRQAEAKHAQLREALKANRGEQQRLERVRGNLPLVAERAAKQAELESLAEAPALTPDAAERRVTAQERLRGAEETKAAAGQRLHKLEAEMEGLVVRHSVLEQGSAIEQAYHGVATYRTAREAIPGIATQHAAQTKQIHQLLAEIEPACEIEQAVTLLPPETLAARIQSLCEDHGRLSSFAEQLNDQIRTKATALNRLRERLDSLPEPAPIDELETSLAGVANVSDLEARQGKFERDIADLQGRLQAEAAALWAGSVGELIALAVPLPETAAGFEAEFATLTQDERLVVDKIATLTRDLEDRCRELKALAATGEVVTQAEMAAARGDRDDIWSHVRQIYVERSATPSGDQTPQALADALAEAIQEADRLADLLHADTQRVTNLETTRQRIADMQAEMQRIEHDREQLAGRRQDLQRRWDTLIAPLGRPELIPAALREWLSRHQRLVDKHNDLESLRRDHDRVVGDLSKARVVLNRALIAGGLAGWAAEETAVNALARAQKAVSAARTAKAARDTTLAQIDAGEDELRILQAQREEATAKLAEWRQDWSAAAQSLRLSADALPIEAKTRLDQYSQLAAALDELTNLDADASRQHAVVSAFEATIAQIAQSAEEAAEHRDSAALAERLYAALGEARGGATKRQQLANDIKHEQQALDAAETAAQQATKQLDELVRQARCLNADDLPDIEAKAVRKQTLEQRRVEIDEQLVQQNARRIDEVVREAEGLDLDGIGRQIAEAATEIEDLEAEVEAAQSARFQAKQQLDAIDGGPAAAEAQQNLSSLSARIAKEARAYARARMAGAVLNRVVQVYRDRHQGPLLRRAAEVFARITLNSFSGLTIDYEDDRQVLLGMRPDGTRVPVGGMSQGTRDQLFLSMRLAAIEQHLESRGPMPVIIDDLLVQFDDDRALATMEVLAELSDKTQVLFFTHHRHLVELADQAKLESSISVHNL